MTFAGLNQEQVTLITNHINSVARASLNGCTPFELAQLLIDRKLLDLCQLERILANQVILKPSLLKSNCRILFRYWFHSQTGGSYFCKRTSSGPKIMPVLQKKALFSAFIICQVLRIIQNYMEVSPAKSLILSATIHGGSYFFIQPEFVNATSHAK